MNYLFPSCEKCQASKQTTEWEPLPLNLTLCHSAELLRIGIPAISVQALWLGVMVTSFRASPLGVTVQSLWKCCASLLGKGFDPKEEWKIILITCNDPSAADNQTPCLALGSLPPWPARSCLFASSSSACLPPAKTLPPCFGPPPPSLARASSPSGRAGFPRMLVPCETWSSPLQ